MNPHEEKLKRMKLLQLGLFICEVSFFIMGGFLLGRGFLLEGLLNIWIGLFFAYITGNEIEKHTMIREGLR